MTCSRGRYVENVNTTESDVITATPLALPDALVGAENCQTIAENGKGQDYLFNLAGQTSHMDSMSAPDTDLEINCRAQLSILKACRKYNPSIKVVFASTRQLYGKPD